MGTITLKNGTAINYGTKGNSALYSESVYDTVLRAMEHGCDRKLNNVSMVMSPKAEIMAMQSETEIEEHSVEKNGILFETAFVLVNGVAEYGCIRRNGVKLDFPGGYDKMYEIFCKQILNKSEK